MSSALLPKPMDLRKPDPGGSLPKKRGETLSERVKDEEFQKGVTDSTGNLLKSLGFKKTEKIKVKTQAELEVAGTSEGTDDRTETSNQSDQPLENNSTHRNSVGQPELTAIESTEHTPEHYERIIEERDNKIIESQRRITEQHANQRIPEEPFGSLGLHEPEHSHEQNFMKNEVLPCEQKVPKLESGDLGSEEQPLKLVDKWYFNHVQSEASDDYRYNSFTVSDSGAVVLSCNEKPSLSMIYPNTGKAPSTISDGKRYRSATFVKLCGKEFLASACDDNGHGSDGGNLYLWDIKQSLPKKVFDLKSHLEKPTRWMNIFVINERTVGYGEVFASSDGTHRVFILNMDTEEEWRLSSMIKLNTTTDVSDMAYMKAADGTPCLLLCCPHDRSVQAVEMVGGRIRWKTGVEQMGEKCFPWSICIDKDTVYVADCVRHKLHLMSAEDGVVIKSIKLRRYGITMPFTVRCHGDYLYVEYKIPGQKYAISKFVPENGSITVDQSNEV